MKILISPEISKIFRIVLSFVLFIICIYIFIFPGCFLSHINAIIHIITDNNEPAGAAIPIGKSEAVKYFDAIYERGIRAQIIDNELCIKDIIDNPYAQKYPLKQKWTPANMQSHT